MQLEKPRPAGLFAFQGLRRGAWVVRAVAVPKWPAYRYDLLPLWSARHELPIAFATEYPWSFLLSLLRSRLPLPISISLLPVVVIRVVLVLWLISGAVRDCKGCGRASVGKVRTPDLSLRRAGGDVDDGLDEAGRAGQGRAEPGRAAGRCRVQGDSGALRGPPGGSGLAELAAQLRGSLGRFKA